MRSFSTVAIMGLALFAAAFSLSSQAAARMRIDIDLTSQRMQVTAPGGETYFWAISSGRRGYSTPTGLYSAYRLERVYFSRKYDNAPMPHAIFFRGGYAIHGTQSVRLLGRPASHGCVRLAPAHAALLFGLVQRHGARITIRGNALDTDKRVASVKPARLKQARPRLRPMPQGRYLTPQVWEAWDHPSQAYYYYHPR